MKTKGLRKTFFTGSNSTCRQHIRQHFEVYKQRCEAEGIQMSQRAIPPPILKEMAAAKSPKKQSTLNKHLMSGVVRPSEFNRDAVLDAVVKFIVCDDQVSLEASESLLNTLSNFIIVVSSRGQGNIQELPCHNETKNGLTRLTDHTYRIGTYS